VTQSYDAGCCVYFYYGFKKLGLDNPIHTFEEIEEMARNVILQTGGSVSHHHGIGKNRARWFKETVSDVGVQVYKAAKKQLDPNNIFAAGNLLPELNHPEAQKMVAKL
jgi:alkyldihydroxyacetonephosphate synthase